MITLNTPFNSAIVSLARRARLCGLALATGMALLLSANALEAGAISWRSTPLINELADKSVMGTGQLIPTLATTTSFLYAENTGGGATTYDGITYSAGTIDFGASSTLFHQAANLVSRSGTFAPTNSVETVTIGAGGVGPDLIIGQRYIVELLFMDGRGFANGRSAIVDGRNLGSYDNGINGVSWGDGLLVRGVFVAEATSQIFTIQSSDGGTQLNALLLGFHVPEPSTGLLMSFGLFGLVMKRRTRSKRG